MLLHEIGVGPVHRQFGRGQREYQPAVTKIDCTKTQEVAKEHAVGLGVLAIQQEVSASNHAAKTSKYVWQLSREIMAATVVLP
ncbi:MAG: hypothetical protein WB869_14105 [Candidatus Acidiferrales bacterium]